MDVLWSLHKRKACEEIVSKNFVGFAFHQSLCHSYDDIPTKSYSLMQSSLSIWRSLIHQSSKMPEASVQAQSLYPQGCGLPPPMYCFQADFPLR